MAGEFRADVEPVVIEAEKAILALVKETVPAAGLRRIGPVGITAPSWSCWIVTPTDTERDKLASDAVLLEELRCAGAKAGFAPDSFTIQSQETVERDFEGSWFYAMR